MRLRLPLALSLVFTLACVGPFGGRTETPPSVSVTEPAFPDSEESDDTAEPSDDTSEPSDDTGDTEPPDDTEPPEGLTVDASPSGDISCFTGELESHTVLDTSDDVVVNVRVQDWETRDGVENPSLTIWESGSELGTAEGDDDGSVGQLQLPICKTLLVAAETDPALDETIPTFSTRMFSDADTDWTIPSLSSTTYNIIPGLLGVTIAEDKGLVLGQIHGCDGEPLDHVEVRFRAGGDSHYFVSEFPNRDQHWTSEDGWFALTNAPPERGSLQAWIWDGSAHVLLAEAEITAVERGARLVELHAAIDGENQTPEACR